MTEFFLYSQRLAFRTWSITDLPLANNLWGDPMVMRLIAATRTLNKQQIQERLRMEIAQQETYGVQYWPVFLRTTSVHVGCCGLRPHGVEDAVFEIGVHLRPEYWGCGYAAEACKAAIQYAFCRLKVRALFAGHNPANAASRALLERLGFRYTHDEFYAPTGLEHPSYELRRQDWETAPRPKTWD